MNAHDVRLYCYLLKQLEYAGLIIDANTSDDRIHIKPDVSKWPMFAAGAILARFSTVDEVIAWVDAWQKCQTYVNLGAAKVGRAESAKRPRKGKKC